MNPNRSARGISTLLVALTLGVAAPAAAEGGEVSEGQEVTKGQEEERRSRDIHLSFSAGYLRPWDSADDGGFQLAVSGMKGLGSNRFWMGAELEFRKATVDVKRNFSPDYDSILFRYLFQYHPWPDAPVSPYVGIGSGLALHVVDRDGRVNGVKRRFRSSPVSGGFTLLGILGAQTALSEDRPLSAFVETRFGTTSDFWKKKSANWQMDQVGGFTASAGFRWTF